MNKRDGIDPYLEKAGGSILNIGTPLFKHGDRVTAPDGQIGTVHEDLAAVWIACDIDGVLRPYLRSQVTLRPALWEYFCINCGTERHGALDRPHGMGGYSWSCPDCGSHDIGSRQV